MVFGLKYYLDEAQYAVQRTVRSVQGKFAQMAVRMTMGGGAAAVATKFSLPFRDALNLSPIHGVSTASVVGTGELIASAAGGLATAGIGIAIDAYQNQMEFRRSERQLTELYRPQVAGVLGKERGAVTIDDLYSVAETNPTLGDELTRHRQMRNVKNVAAVGGTVLAFAAVFAAITLFPPLGALALSASAAGIASGAGLAFAATAGVVGYASFQFARRGIKNIGKKLLGLDVPSTEDRVHELSKQHRREEAISPSQVLDVFASAQPDVGQSIQQQFGAPFDQLSPEKKASAAAAYDASLNLTQTATLLNNDQMNVRELVFLVHGQSSGVYPDPSLKDVLKSKAQDALDPVQEKLSDIKLEATDRFQDWRETRRQSKLQDKVAKAIEEGKALPKEALDAAPETQWRSIIEAERAQKAMGGAEQTQQRAGGRG